MTSTSRRILYLSTPVEPPWTRSDKNLVRGVAANLKRYRGCVLTHQGVTLTDPNVETESAWGPRTSHDTPLSKRLGLFGQLIGQRETALVHLFWPAEFVVANVVRTAARMRGLPVIHTLVRAPRTTVGIKQALAGSPVVCLTQETQHRLIAEGVQNTLWIPPGIALPEPIPVGDLAGIRRKYRIPLDEPVVVYAGDYRHSNAARTFAAAMPRILRQSDCHFVLACRIRNEEDRAEEVRIKEAITADGIAHHVTFLNEVSSLRELFSIASVQVFPADSHHEKMDLPMVLLEGMAEGVATVVAQKPPLTELVQAGVVLGVPPMNPVALAVAVTELLSRDDRRFQLGEAGRRHVQKRHDIRLVAAQYEELYDEVLAVAKRPRSGAWGIG
jgi:phosphatidylinositol alpha-1,6-mannosyltransferase